MVAGAGARRGGAGAVGAARSCYKPTAQTKAAVEKEFSCMVEAPGKQVDVLAEIDGLMESARQERGDRAHRLEEVASMRRLARRHRAWAAPRRRCVSPPRLARRAGVAAAEGRRSRLGHAGRLRLRRPLRRRGKPGALRRHAGREHLGRRHLRAHRRARDLGRPTVRHHASSPAAFRRVSRWGRSTTASTTETSRTFGSSSRSGWSRATSGSRPSSASGFPRTSTSTWAKRCRARACARSWWASRRAARSAPSCRAHTSTRAIRTPSSRRWTLTWTSSTAATSTSSWATRWCRGCSCAGWRATR